MISGICDLWSSDAVWSVLEASVINIQGVLNNVSFTFDISVEPIILTDVNPKEASPYDKTYLTIDVNLPSVTKE